MARRSARPTRTSRNAPPPPSPSRNASPCLCGLPADYGDCCGRFHSAVATAPTAERLMRSRYSAFAVGNEPYLLSTWHPDTRPSRVELDPAVRWAGAAAVLSTTRAGAFPSLPHRSDIEALLAAQQ